MPVRMVDDPDDQGNDYNNDNSGGGGGRNTGGGGNLLNFLPLLMMLFRSKLGLPILIIGGILYFAMGQKGCNGAAASENSLATGGVLDPAQFSKAKVYEGQAGDDVKNPLPEFVSLGRFAPDRKNQGQQGSCVAWSSAYAAQTIAISASRGVSPNQIAFSPSFMYNQIGLEGCQGSYIIKAMELMKAQGGVPFNSFVYDDRDCSTNPPDNLESLAQKNRIHGFNRLTTTEDPNGINLRAVKEHLASDAPVVIGMMVGGSFMQDMMGKKVWEPTQSDYQQTGFGGHAMCVIGYDDRLAGGAFQIMNSWGSEWGENGIGWVRYGDFKEFVREAYGIDPLPKEGAALNVDFDCEIGLWAGKQQAGSYLPVSYGGRRFSSSMKKGTRFKVEVKNSTECYVYVFGQETDGSSYTLFPYPSETNPAKTAFSAYCGITGTRLFPRGKSLMPDSIGTRDFIAVVVSKKELPWFDLNAEIGKSTDYTAAVGSALAKYGNNTIAVSTTGKGTLRFTAPAKNEGIAFAVIEINKQ